MNPAQICIFSTAVRDSCDEWLREEVAPVYDAMQANPDRARPAEDVFARIRDIHAARLARRKYKI